MKKIIAFILIIHLTSAANSKLIRTNFLLPSIYKLLANQVLGNFFRKEYPEISNFDCWFLAIDNQRNSEQRASITAPEETPFARFLKQLPNTERSYETGQPITQVKIPAKSIWVGTCPIDPRYRGKQEISCLLGGMTNLHRFSIPKNYLRDHLMVCTLLEPHHNQA